jgi:hypothetical protein
MYSSQIAITLRESGHDVVAVTERAELVGVTDAELLRAMAAEGRALLTENVADFAPLVKRAAAAGDAHAGLVYSSPAAMPRARETIGVFVKALEALLRRFPGDDDIRNRIEWLTT